MAYKEKEEKAFPLKKWKEKHSEGGIVRKVKPFSVLRVGRQKNPHPC